MERGTKEVEKLLKIIKAKSHPVEIEKEVMALRRARLITERELKIVMAFIN